MFESSMAKGHRSRVGGGLWDNNPTKIFGTPPGPLKGVFLGFIIDFFATLCPS